MASEVLDADDLAAITGRTRPSDQIAWLEENHWPYVRNAAGRPIVGTALARAKLGGGEIDLMPVKREPPKNIFGVK